MAQAQPDAGQLGRCSPSHVEDLVLGLPSRYLSEVLSPGREMWKDSMTSMTSLHHYTTVIIMHDGAFIHSLFPKFSYRFNIMTQYMYILYINNI